MGWWRLRSLLLWVGMWTLIRNFLPWIFDVLLYWCNIFYLDLGYSRIKHSKQHINHCSNYYLGHHLLYLPVEMLIFLVGLSTWVTVSTLPLLLFAEKQTPIEITAANGGGIRIIEAKTWTSLQFGPRSRMECVLAAGIWGTAVGLSGGEGHLVWGELGKVCLVLQWCGMGIRINQMVVGRNLLILLSGLIFASVAFLPKREV